MNINMKYKFFTDGNVLAQPPIEHHPDWNMLQNYNVLNQVTFCVPDWGPDHHILYDSMSLL